MEAKRSGPQGSFGVPNEMLKSIEEARAGRVQPKVDALKEEKAEILIGVGDEKKLNPEELAKREEEEVEKGIIAYKEALEKDLEVTLTDEDLRNYILKGEIRKKIAIIPGLLSGEFKNLRASEYQEVERMMREITDKNSLTDIGIKNERSLITLAHCWLRMGDDKKDSGTVESRLENIKKLDTAVVDAASSTWRNFNSLIQSTVRQRSRLKK